MIDLQAPRNCLTLVICHDRARFRAVEFAARSSRRECEYDGCSGERAVILILNTNHRIAAAPLANTVNCALSIDNNNIQFCRRRCLLGLQWCKGPLTDE